MRTHRLSLSCNTLSADTSLFACRSFLFTLRVNVCSDIVIQVKLSKTNVWYAYDIYIRLFFATVALWPSTKDRVLYFYVLSSCLDYLLCCVMQLSHVSWF